MLFALHRHHTDRLYREIKCKARKWEIITQEKIVTVLVAGVLFQNWQRSKERERENNPEKEIKIKEEMNYFSADYI